MLALLAILVNKVRFIRNLWLTLLLGPHAMKPKTRIVKDEDISLPF